MAGKIEFDRNDDQGYGLNYTQVSDGLINPPSIIPDLIIRNRENHYDVELNDSRFPQVRISRSYYRMLKDPRTPQDAKEFLLAKFRKASWLIKAIDERNTTLLSIGRCLISLQHNFLAQGPQGLRPLTQAQVAGLVGRHPWRFAIEVKIIPEVFPVKNEHRGAVGICGRINQTVYLVIENTGYGAARNVSVAVSGGPGINLLSSVSTFLIPNLTQGSSVTEPVLISSQSSGGAALLASIAYYSSNLKQRFTSAQSVNLTIAPAAQFKLGSMGTSASPGSTDVPIEFSITNTGTSDGTTTLVTDPIPTGVTYLPGSITFNAAARTDANDGDNADYNITQAGKVYVNVGTVTGSPELGNNMLCELTMISLASLTAARDKGT